MKYWACDACGADNPYYLTVAEPYIGDQNPPSICGNCGFCYVVKRRDSADIALAWNEIWGSGYTSAWPAVKARLTYVAEWMKLEIPGNNNRLLDVGAGEGDFLKIIDGKHFTPSGLEPNESNCRKINKLQFPCWNGTIENFKPIGLYDAVTLLWTLENTGNCIGVLKKCHSVLKPGGYIVVATGSRILVPFKKPLSGYFSTNAQDLHCFRFSANSLCAVLNKSGFRNITLNRYLDTDYLVAAGRASDVAEPGILYQDNPSEVLNFFRDWSKMFP